MTPTTTGRQQDTAVRLYCEWLRTFAIVSEKVDGHWRHEPFFSGRYWRAYMAGVETRTTAISRN